MPNWNWAGTEMALRTEAEMFLWGLCLLVGALLAGALAVLAAEVVQAWRSGPALSPSSEFQGFGQPLRRPRGRAPGFVSTP
ncbi:MAG: hypothetical protein M9913_22415 [Bryobacteraceae bacterium]|nr:hypothetical protein [Solibacteraceae bacterium]MCL4841239.1 hypothetical protein [Bryobacteraceae bacterium]MCO5353595.1 hypothetical protein [Bryobacteraceae bacterium]